MASFHLTIYNKSIKRALSSQAPYAEIEFSLLDLKVPQQDPLSSTSSLAVKAFLRATSACQAILQL
jgi:hypothetical protein